MADIDVEEHARAARWIRLCGSALWIAATCTLGFTAARYGGPILGLEAVVFSALAGFGGWMNGAATCRLINIRRWR